MEAIVGSAFNMPLKQRNEWKRCARELSLVLHSGRSSVLSSSYTAVELAAISMLRFSYARSTKAQHEFVKGIARNGSCACRKISGCVSAAAQIESSARKLRVNASRYAFCCGPPLLPIIPIMWCVCVFFEIASFAGEV
jgi:hypothetical protein